MKPGWNPIRRNRRIGRKRRERRRDNRFVVPDSRRRQGRSLWERINEPRCVYRDIAGRRFRFLVEKTRHGIVHACTIDDIAAVLGQVPRPDIEGLRWIVLLQPTRKEEGLEPVWGRMVFEASFGPVVGPALILEAVDTSKPSRWRRPLSIRDRRELERLREDGHDVVATARHYTVGSSLEAVRATQLYHTVFHEIGHWIDWRERVVRRGGGRRAKDSYFKRPWVEKENFADSYADGLRRKLTANGVFPFERIYDQEAVANAGLRISDFAPEGIAPPTAPP